MPKICIQILNNPQSTGGIQSIAQQIEKVMTGFGAVCESSDLTKISMFLDLFRGHNGKDDLIVFIHGMSNFVTLRALLFILFCKIIGVRSKKIIWQPHFHPFEKHNRPFFASLYFHLVNRLLGILVDKIIAITVLEKSMLTKFFDIRKIEIIPNPLRFNEEGTINVKKYGSEDRCDYFLLVGRNEPNKNFSAIIEKKSYWLSVMPKIKFVTNERKEIPDDMDILSNVSEVQLMDLYANAFALIVPSDYEAFSLVALEALSLGTPVICSANIGIQEFQCVQDVLLLIDFDNPFIDCERVMEIREELVSRRHEIVNFFGEAAYAKNLSSLI